MTTDLSGSLFVPCGPVDLASEEEALGGLHLQGGGELGGADIVVLHPVPWGTREGRQTRSQKRCMVGREFVSLGTGTRCAVW